MHSLPMRIRLRDGSLDIVDDFQSQGPSRINPDEDVYSVRSRIDWKRYSITFDDVDVLSLSEYAELDGPDTTPEPDPF